MQIIADSGGTKTDWRIIYSNGKIEQFVSTGLNPTYLTNSQLHDLLKKELSFELSEPIEELHFYGAGCQSEQAKKIIADALTQRLGAITTLHVHTDLLAAARACCGHETGIVSILGTGSNACLYEDGEIKKQKMNLGFILGDEGSGAHIGKALLKDYMEGIMPKDLSELFEGSFNGLSQSEVVERLYKKEKPNTYLAGFFPFAIENQNHPYLQKLLFTSFEHFLQGVLHAFPEAKELPFHFVGGVAFQANKFLRQSLQQLELKTGIIMQSPIAGLTLYHKSTKA